jgi:uncharacterized RDD family membrane protein YckC
MSAVATFFLRAKHWQVFLLLSGIVYVAGPVAVLLDLIISRSPNELLKITVPLGGVMVLFMLSYLSWLWSVGWFLNSVGEPGLRLRKGFFRIALLFPAVYILLFLVSFGTSNPVFLALIFPLHLFATFCLLYDLYFVSKSLALVETGKQVSFPDYAGSFFLLWFFPIGVWFIQPKVNRLFAGPFSQASTPPAELLHPVAGPAIGISDTGAEIQSAKSLTYAGFWLRLLAALIDGVLISFPLFGFAFFIILVVRLVSARKGYDPAIGILAGLAATALVVPWLYFSLLESSRWQGTPGKSLLRLYVVDLKGHRLTWSRATGRNLAKYLSNLTVGVGHLMCGFTKKKQALHDVLAGCLVLRRPKD